MNSPKLKVFSRESDVNIVGGKLKYIAHFSDFEYLATGTMRGGCRVILISEINYYSHRILWSGRILSCPLWQHPNLNPE
jgi:hypothetical protein